MKAFLICLILFALHSLQSFSIADNEQRLSIGPDRTFDVRMEIKLVPISQHEAQGIPIIANRDRYFWISVTFTNVSKKTLRTFIGDNLMPILVALDGSVVYGGITRESTIFPSLKDFPILQPGGSSTFKLLANLGQYGGPTILEVSDHCNGTWGLALNREHRFLLGIVYLDPGPRRRAEDPIYEWPRAKLGINDSDLNFNVSPSNWIPLRVQGN